MPRHNSGWSLLELLIAIVILLLLYTVGSAVISFAKSKAAFATCVSNLRSLHGGFSTYLQDHGMVWPQIPESVLDASEEDEEREWEWWYNTMKDYGVTKKTWLCPSDSDTEEARLDEAGHYAGSYVPSQFDETPNTAYRWAAQPWLIERGQFHGKDKGPNLILPDGSVQRGLSLPMDPPSGQK